MATLTEMKPRGNVAPAVAPVAVEPERSSPSSRWRDFLAMGSRWSTGLVLAVLAGLAVWGHYSGWKLPKFSALFSASPDKPDWCDAHGVPESICVECKALPVKSVDAPAKTITVSITKNGKSQDKTFEMVKDAKVTINGVRKALADIMPGMTAQLVFGTRNEVLEIDAMPHYGWCRGHGVHDCPFEHPDVAQLKQPWQVTQADLDRAQRALALKDRPENSSKCQQHQRCIQFASQEVMEKMGVDVVPAREAPISESVTATGEITAAGPQVAPLYTPVAGRVWQITEKGKLGALVKEGDVLALIDSVEIGKAKAEFLQALAQLDSRTKAVESMRSLVPTAISPARFREEEAALREAEVKVLATQQSMANLGLSIRYDDIKHLTSGQLNDHVRFLGLPPDVVRAISGTTTTTNLVAVKASRDGYVKEVGAVKDVMAGPSQPLFVVVDTRQMWLTLNVRIEDVKYLRIRDASTGTPGQTVRFRPEGRDQEVTGALVWKSTSVDDTTRTVQFRAELPNPDGSLLANTFGTGQIILREEKKSIVVPNDSIHWEGDCHIVFVRDKDFLDADAAKVFHVRSVRPGVKNGPYTEVIAGLLPGEVVASRNSAALRAQLLKNNLGAG